MNKAIHACMVIVAAVAISFISIVPSHGVTAAPGLLQYQQPDGTVIQYYLKGDENGSWKETKDGSLILQDNRTGYYYYANHLFNHIYQSAAKVGIDKKPLLGATGADAQDLRSQLISEPGNILIQSGSSSLPLEGTASVPATQPVLVLIINFDNISSTAPQGYWQDTFFINESSSVSGYFNEVSYGATSIVPASETGQTANDGVVTIALPQDHPATAGFTDEVMELIPGIARQALQQADAFVDFASFDVNDDGVIETSELHIATIFAGGEAATGGIYKSVWAHSWAFDPLTVDGTEISSYIAAGEKFADSEGNPGTTNMTCGVFCHELGHSMGLPDLYDYGYDSQGVGGLSLMAAGSWGSPGGLPGKYPVHLDAWSKIALGFVTPIEAVDSTEYLMNETTEADYNVLKVTDPSNPDQYFLIENRLNNGYDFGLNGLFANMGIVIYHIDEAVMRYAATHSVTFPSFNDNRFRKAIDVEEANQSVIYIPELDYYGNNSAADINPLPQQWRGNTFFAAGDATRYTNYFSDTTLPSAKFYSNPVDQTIIPPLIYDAETDQEWYFESDATIGAQNDPSGVTIEVMDTATDTMRVRYNMESFEVILAASPASGGTVTGGARVEPNTTLSLQATPKPGYIFTGWSENGTVVTTDNPFVMQINKDWNLTAEFKPINYTVTFDANGGTGLPLDAMEMTYDVSKQVPANTFSIPGYTFDGWSLTPGGAKVAWNQDPVENLTTVDGDSVTLYARWKINNYSISYNSWGGTNDVQNPTTYTINSGDIQLRSAVRTGYKFLGWYRDSNYTGLPVVMIPSGSMEGLSLHAKWQPNTYRIKFYSNGGFGTMVDQAMTYDAPANLVAASFSKPGYHFLGWATSPTGPVVYKHAASVKNLSAANGGIVNLYAKWGLNTYAINFNYNGATAGVMYIQSITYNTSAALTANGYKKTGYSFLGWATSPTGPVVYKNAATVKNLTTSNEEVIVLYAKWGAPITSAASYSYNSVKVSWAYAGSATSYRIYRATSAAGTYSLVYVASSTARSYVNTGLVTGKTYYYKVSVAVGEKRYHHSLYKSTKPIPAAPTVTLSKASSTSIKVTWSGVSGTTKYQIFRAASATGTYTYQYTASSTARSWINTGLSAGKTYYYKVRAYHLEGTTKVYGSSSAVKYLKL